MAASEFWTVQKKQPANVDLSFEFSTYDIAPKGGRLYLSIFISGKKPYINEEWIKAFADKTQVFICTHSLDLLDHFSDCSEKVFCFRNKDTNHFSISRLPKIELESKVREGWQIGDFYRVGDPSVGGWSWSWSW